MITGGTGCGKSSTINALFGTEKAKVGTTSNPETQAIDCYEFSPNFTLWDSPGLGDGVEKDRQHAKGITKLLTEKDENGSLKIDAVLVILDGGSRDLGTSYQLINEVIAPCLHEDDHNRLIIAINQADMAMKGRHFNQDEAAPDATLQDFLARQAASIRQRILVSTGLMIRNPVVFSAEYGFNIKGILDSIIDNDKWVPRKGYDVIDPQNAPIRIDNQKYKVDKSFSEDDYDFSSYDYDDPIEDFFDGIIDFFSDLFW